MIQSDTKFSPEFNIFTFVCNLAVRTILFAFGVNIAQALFTFNGSGVYIDCVNKVKVITKLHTAVGTDLHTAVGILGQKKS